MDYINLALFTSLQIVLRLFLLGFVYSITFSYLGGRVKLSHSVAQSGRLLVALADKVQRVSNYLPTHNKICLQLFWRLFLFL